MVEAAQQAVKRILPSDFALRRPSELPKLPPRPFRVPGAQMADHTPQPPPPTAAPRRLLGVLRLRCPVCWQGAMFAHPLRMHDQCPHCAYTFDKGNGYFVGAMYSSYTLSLGIAIVLAGLLWWAGWSAWPIVAACSAVVALLGPLAVFPYSRLLWVWIEREGWLHDGSEDNDALRQRYLASRGGKKIPPGP
jgi:uncharacterized protein (DUF983 family)